MLRHLLLAAAVLSATLAAQTSLPIQYVADTYAGTIADGEGGPAPAALLQTPTGIAVDLSGNLVIAEREKIRVVERGVIRTLRANRWPGARRMLFRPEGLYILQSTVLTLVATDGSERRIAGTGSFGATPDGTPAVRANFGSLTDFAVADSGEIFLSEQSFHVVRKIDRAGNLSTVAGISGRAGYSGDNGPAGSATLSNPSSIAIDRQGQLVISDFSNARIRRVDQNGVIRTIAGTGFFGQAISGPALSTPVGGVEKLVVTADGDILLGASLWIGKLTADGRIVNVGGNGANCCFSGDGGPALQARLVASTIAIDDKSGIFLLDAARGNVRYISQEQVINTVAGRYTIQADRIPAREAILLRPTALACAADGTVFATDTTAAQIRAIRSDGFVDIVAGTGAFGMPADSGPAKASTLGTPFGLGIDSAQNLLYGDTSYSRIMKIDKGGMITRIAGSGTFGSSGDGAAARSVAIQPTGIAADPSGNVLLVESSYHTLRRVDSEGLIARIAGTRQSGTQGDGGPASEAQLANPTRVAVQPDGTIAIADGNGQRLRVISPAGRISTILGNGTTALANLTGEAPAATLRVSQIQSLAIDGARGWLIGDFNRLYRVDANGLVRRIAGLVTGSSEFADTTRGALDLGMSTPQGICVNPAGEIFLSVPAPGVIRRLRPNPAQTIEIRNGNNQQGAVGEILLQPLRVRVMGRLAFANSQIPVTFAITKGQARLSRLSAVTDDAGEATTVVTLGDAVGEVEVEARVAGLSSAKFQLSVAAAGPRAPVQISSASIAGAGDGVTPVHVLSPGGLATIFANGFLTAGAVPELAAVEGGALPTTLAAWCVEVNGRRVPILHVFPGQLTFQVPFDLVTSAAASVRAVYKCGQPDAAATEPINMPAADAAPQWFLFRQSATGNQPVAAIDAATGSLIGPEGLYGTALPARRGQIITIFGTGFGRTNNDPATGTIPGAAAQVSLAIGTRIGSLEVPDGDILYAGIAPGLIGVYQLNLRIPANAPIGSQLLTITLGAASTPGGGALVIRE